jgi:hypothetical protein
MSRPSRLYTLLMLALLATGCAEGPTTAVSDLEPSASRAAAEPGSPTEDWLKAVRQATVRYNATTQALKAGYVPDTHCVQSPFGGMGYHWANPTRIDAAFDPLEPEVVLYAPSPRGLKLVAVEYIVLNVGQPRPYFGDHPFDIGGVMPLTLAGIAHWSLHVWLHEDNPNGVFTPFNPNVSCS